MKYFERVTQVHHEPDVREITVLSDKAPRWLRSGVRDAHFGVAPNDWIYETCARLVDSIDCHDDSVREIVDSLVSVYNHELFDWLASVQGTELLDQACENAGEISGEWVDQAKIVESIARLQYWAIYSIFGALREAYNDYHAAMGEDYV